MSLFQKDNGAKYIERMAKPLASFYAEAYRQLKAELNSSASTLWKQDHANAMLARINEVAKHLDKETKRILERDIPVIYKAFGEETLKNLRKIDKSIPKNLSSIHVEAINIASQDAYLKFGNTITGVKRSAEGFVKFAQQEALRQKIVAGVIKGDAAKEVAKAVKDEIERQDIVSLIDKAGKGWKLDVYANMLTRQTMANASRDAVRNNAQEYGFDVVQVSRHGSPHQECAVWEGEFLSLTGETEGLPTLEEAEGAGLFHVGCRHGYSVSTQYRL